MLYPMFMLRLEFKVDVSTQADCGKILDDLVIEEQLPNGQTKRIRQPFFPSLLSTPHGSKLPVHKCFGRRGVVIRTAGAWR